MLLGAGAQGQHLGVYTWASEVNSLPRAQAALARFHFDTIRIFLGGKYDYVHAENAPGRFSELRSALKGRVTLAKIAALPRYRALLDNPKVTTWLTAYPVFDYGKGPVEIDLKQTSPDWDEESRQMRELVESLYRRYGAQSRVILISNNETEEKLRETGSPEIVMRDLDVRMRAVEAARAKFPDTKLKVMFGVEIKQAATSLGSLRFDFVSYSAWETAAHPETIEPTLREIGGRTRANVTAEGRAFFGASHVLIGEFGHAREWPDALSLAPFLEAVKSGRVRYGVYWQLYDNARGDVRKFGLLDKQDHLTPQGRALR